MYLPSKSKFAFDTSCQALIPSSKGHLYLWTFTFAEALDMKEARARWSKFLQAFRRRRKHIKLSGVRVFELHPGGHGLHIHLATSCYLHVNEVRGLWLSVGGGRINVKPVHPSRAGYLSKYLRKGGRSECFKGVRLWDSFGGFDKTRVKDVKIESNWTRTYAMLVASIGGFKKLRWWQRIRAVENVERDLPWNFGFLPDGWGCVFGVGVRVTLRGARPF